MFSSRILAVFSIAPMFLAIACSGSPDQQKGNDSSEDALTAKTCGGFAGLTCPEGFECDMPEPHHPDQVGTCKKVTHACGGIAGLVCPDGFECDMPEPHFPDQGGTCKKAAPKTCGGIAGLECPIGFTCVMPNANIPDQTGTCVKN
jgi:hypothetical protein